MNSAEYNQTYYQRNKEAMDRSHRLWAGLNRNKMRGYARAHDLKRQKEKREFLLIEKNAPCTDCRDYFPPVCMDFDHLPGKKKVACVSKMMTASFSFQQLKDEVAKCELVCANCHRLRTEKRLWLKKLSNP